MRKACRGSAREGLDRRKKKGCDRLRRSTDVRRWHASVVGRPTTRCRQRGRLPACGSSRVAKTAGRGISRCGLGDCSHRHTWRWCYIAAPHSAVAA